MGAALGNQQFTMRNLTFKNGVTAISHYWNWGWTYQGITINNRQLGIDISTGDSDQQSVGAITLFDNSFSNTPATIEPPRTLLRSLILQAASSLRMRRLITLASWFRDLLGRFCKVPLT